MTEGWLLFIILALFAASALFAAGAFIRAKLRRSEEQLRPELPVMVDEEQRPSTTPVREHAKAETDSSLLGLAAGGVVFAAILSWTGLGLGAALAGILLYLIIAVPIALWLHARTLKRQSIARPPDDTNRR
jgi:predicted membrane-bound spermidine synthase